MRRIFLVFPLCVLLLLSACGEDLTPSPYTEVNTLEGAWIEVAENGSSPTSATVVFYNETDSGYSFGAWFEVETLHRSQWCELERVVLPPGYAWDIEAWGRVVLPQGETEQIAQNMFPQYTYNWEGLYGELPKGSYRIVVRVTSPVDLTSSGEEHSTYYMTAEFSIE